MLDSNLLRVLAVTVCLVTTSALQAQRIESMKTARADRWLGCYQRASFLDNGCRCPLEKHYTGDGAGEVASVFFLDVSTGWVLLSSYSEPQPTFDVAATTDSGATWAVTHVLIPAHNIRFAPSGRIDFADAHHGWMNLDVESSSNFRLGFNMKTDDGGKIWTAAISRTSPGVAGSLRFINDRVGWLAGGPGNEHLYLTRDAETNWQEVSLKLPLQARSGVNPAFDVPVFQDKKHGFLPVTYLGRKGLGIVLVLFATDDGGETWKPTRVLSHLPDIYGGIPVPSTIVRGISVTAVAFDRSVTLKAASDIHSAQISSKAELCCVSQVSFVNENEGWTLTSAGLF